MSDPLSELRGLHMPPMDLAAVVAEVCAALAIGLFAAWLIAWFVRLITARRIPPEQTALQQYEALTTGPPDQALASRAAVLQGYAATVEGEGDWLTRLDTRLGGVFSDGAGKGLRDALYRPGSAFDLESFDAEIRTALQRAAR